MTTDGQKQMVTGHVSVFGDGKPLGTMTPAKWASVKREQEPTTEVAIRRAPPEDLHIVLPGHCDASAQTGTYTVTVNPLVNWIWFGFAVMAIDRHRAVARKAPLPSRSRRFRSAATTALLLVLLLPSAGFAQARPRFREERTATAGRKRHHAQRAAAARP